MSTTTPSLHQENIFSQRHNRREKELTDKEAHIQKNGFHETIIDEDIKEAYKRIFQASVDVYNEKQNIKKRKIKNYYSETKAKAKKSSQTIVAKEAVVGFYTTDWKKGSDFGIPPEEQVKMLEEYVKGFVKRNTSFEVIGAYIHGDEEGQPHLHLDYIPIGEGGYKTGMDKRCGLKRALANMGYKTIEGAHSKDGKRHLNVDLWQKDECKILDEITLSRGYEVFHPLRENKKKYERKRTDLYKRDKAIEQREERIKQREKDLKGKENYLKEKIKNQKELEEKLNYLDKKIKDYKKRAEEADIIIERFKKNMEIQ